jgi:hypothetical protein
MMLATNFVNVIVGLAGQLNNEKTSELQSQAFGEALFHKASGSVHLFCACHSGSHTLSGEFLFLRLAMYFDSSYERFGAETSYKLGGIECCGYVHSLPLQAQYQ